MNRKVFIIAIAVLIIDQISKILVGSSIGESSSLTVIDGFFKIVNVANTGAAFSILEGRTGFLSLLSLGVIIIIIKMIKDFKMTKRTIWAFGLLIGGIFGNFGDRMFLGYVRDFLSFKFGGYSFPVFNLADASIVVGVGLLLISMFKGEDQSAVRSKNKRKLEDR